MPAGPFAPGQADQVEQIGIGDLHVVVAALGVDLDEPAKLLVGLVQLAAIAQHLAEHPAGQEMLLILVDGLAGRLLGLVQRPRR